MQHFSHLFLEKILFAQCIFLIDWIQNIARLSNFFETLFLFIYLNTQLDVYFFAI